MKLCYVECWIWFKWKKREIERKRWGNRRKKRVVKKGLILKMKNNFRLREEDDCMECGVGWLEMICKCLGRE